VQLHVLGPIHVPPCSQAGEQVAHNIYRKIMDKRKYFNESKLREAHVDPFHPLLQAHVSGAEQFPWTQVWLQMGN